MIRFFYTNARSGIVYSPFMFFSGQKRQDYHRGTYTGLDLAAEGEDTFVRRLCVYHYCRGGGVIDERPRFLKIQGEIYAVTFAFNHAFVEVE